MYARMERVYFELESRQLLQCSMYVWSCDSHVKLCHVQPPLLRPSTHGMGPPRGGYFTHISKNLVRPLTNSKVYLELESRQLLQRSMCAWSCDSHVSSAGMRWGDTINHLKHSKLLQLHCISHKALQLHVHAHVSNDHDAD